MKEKADVVRGWLRKAASDVVALEAALGVGWRRRGKCGLPAARNWVKSLRTIQRILEWLSILGALAIGPLFVVFGYWQRLMFGVAAWFYFLTCALVVPLLILAGGRLKFVVWQLAVLSLALSVIADDLRVGMRLHVGETASTTFKFWAVGTLLSAPAPVYFILLLLGQRYWERKRASQ
jgi:hypothetical protein